MFSRMLSCICLYQVSSLVLTFVTLEIEILLNAYDFHRVAFVSNEVWLTGRDTLQHANFTKYT